MRATGRGDEILRIEFFCQKSETIRITLTSHNRELNELKNKHKIEQKYLQ